jgi:DNA replication protein DnaC
LRTLEWIGRRENLVICGPSGTGKTFWLEGLGQLAVEAGLKVAWFSLEENWACWCAVTAPTIQ